MFIKPAAPSADVKSLLAGASVTPEFRPFETTEPDMIFMDSTPAFWVMIYIDRSGNVKETTNLSTTVFSTQLRDEFIAATNNYVLQNQHSALSSPHKKHSPSRSHDHRGRSRCGGHLKRRKPAPRVESLVIHCLEADKEDNEIVPLEIGNTKNVTAYYENAFKRLQQLNCRLLAKNFIKLIEPRKQVKHPYSGGRRADVPPGEKGDPELTKPDWWPHDVIHREPDHLRKELRLKLLVHIIQCLLPMGITADRLQEAANDSRRHIKPQERAAILDEVFRVRRLEERYERDEIDGTTQIYVIAHEGAKKGEPDCNDEQLATPPKSPVEHQLEVPQSRTDVPSMPQHVSPLDTSSSFHMSGDLSFGNTGQRTPEFGGSQSEMNHQTLANTPMLTPTNNQYMNRLSFIDSTPPDQIHTVSHEPTHTQADTTALFAAWPHTYQHNIFSRVDYNRASRQMPMPTQIACPSYEVYPSAHTLSLRRMQPQI